MTALTFCRQIGMKENHFFYWQVRIRKEAARQNGEFLPVSINNHAGKVVLTGGRSGAAMGSMKIMQPTCEITFPNGVTIHLSSEVSAQTLGQLNARPVADVADLLRSLYSRIRDMVMDTDYIQSDETTVPIVDDEKHRTVKGYLWQVCAVMQEQLFFHYDKGSRSRDLALGLFAHFNGALQTDGMPCTNTTRARTEPCVLIAGRTLAVALTGL